MCVHSVILPLTTLSIITLMIIENRALWLARSFASSRYNHCVVIITLKASSFQNGSQICWCFGVGNWSIILFSRIIVNVIIPKQLVASGDVNIGEWSPRLRHGDYLTIIPRARMDSESIALEAEGQMGYWLRGHEVERNNCFSKIQLVGQKYWDKTTLAS